VSTLLSVDRAVKVYGRRGRGIEPTVALDDVSISIGRGETLGVVGESGSGKTTLGRVIASLEILDSGSIEFDGVTVSSLRGGELRRARRGFQVVFQNPSSSLDRRIVVGRLLSEPLEIHGIGTDGERRVAVLEMMDRVGLQRSSAEAYIHELSGGQRQRVAIARALMLSPALIVADEPTSALDVSIQAQVLTLMQELKQELGLSYLFISHNLAVVRYMADRIAVMHRGRIVEIGASESVYAAPRHPYTRDLLMATEGRISELDLKDAPEPRGRVGCLYRGRCASESDACRLTPELVEIARHGSVRCHHPLTTGNGAMR
jgi:oligopeptide/dipeptide ABC transporter ATP-binding protein